MRSAQGGRVMTNGEPPRHGKPKLVLRTVFGTTQAEAYLNPEGTQLV